MKYKQILALILSLLAFAACQVYPNQQQNKSQSGYTQDKNKITPEEVKQVREIADLFIRQFRETRDLTPIVDKMFTNNFKKMVKEDTSWSGGVAMGRALLEHLDGEQRLRCFIVGFNLQYMIRLYIASKTPLDAEHISRNGSILPPKVTQFLKDNAPREEEIKTTEEARRYLAFLEQATLLLREEAIKNPPEETEQFKKNLAAFESHLDEHKEEQPSVVVYDENRQGLTAGTRLFRLVIPFHVGLAMVKENDELKLELALTNLPPD